MGIVSVENEKGNQKIREIARTPHAHEVRQRCPECPAHQIRVNFCDFFVLTTEAFILRKIILRKIRRVCVGQSLGEQQLFFPSSTLISQGT